MNPSDSKKQIELIATDKELRIAIFAIKRELKYNAELKFPTWPLDPIRGAAIIAEEAGETIKASLQAVCENGHLADMGKEAIQTAAMAIRFLIFLGRTQKEYR